MFTPAHIVQTAYHAFKKTGLYSLELKEWLKKAMADKMWDRFKIIFAEKCHDLVEDTKVATGDAVFHSANVIQEIKGALEHLALAAGSDKDIVTKLTEAVDQLTKNNAALTSQLSELMKINL